MDMMLEHFYKNAWRRKCCLKEIQLDNHNQKIELKEVIKINWCQRFIIYMKNRMTMGFYRYGESRNYNYIDYAKFKLEKYIKTGNMEFLVDVANLMMCEFIWGKHKNKHFSAVEQDEHNVKKIK